MKEKHRQRLRQLAQMLGCIPGSGPIFYGPENAPFRKVINGPIDWALEVFKGQIRRNKNEISWEKPFCEFFGISVAEFKIVFVNPPVYYFEQAENMRRLADPRHGKLILYEESYEFHKLI